VFERDGSDAGGGTSPKSRRHRASFSGEIVEERTAEDLEREAQLRSELARKPTRSTMEANAKYGWLGRHSDHSQVSVLAINYELRCLFTFFRWCIRQNHLFANPVANVEKFRIPKHSLPRFMTSDELRKFFGACNEDERRLFSTILLTGMRKGEVEHLTCQDVNFELGIIFIQAKPEIGWQPKTDERIVPISPTLQQLLLEQSARRRSKQWVFANQKGQPDGHILEKLKKICRRAGIKAATVHALRHSFGAHLRMAGVSLADIADLLRHKDLATTQTMPRSSRSNCGRWLESCGARPGSRNRWCVTQTRHTHQSGCGDQP
jgi:integrase